MSIRADTPPSTLQAPAAGQQLFLAACSVVAGYRGRSVVRDVDVDVRAGEVHGLIGPNGAGKSTLLRVLGGIARATSGRIETAEGHLGTLPPRERARLIAFLPQDTRIDEALTVRAVVELGRYAHRRRFDRMRGTLTPEDVAAVDASLRRVGALHLADRPITELSGGQRQLVLIAKQLSQESRVLLLDEPVSALDLGYQMQVLTLLRDLADEGRSVVVVLHDLNLAARSCDRLTLLSDGEVRGDGTPEQVLTPALLAECYGVHCVVDRDPHLRAPRVTVLGRTSAPLRNTNNTERENTR